jgi:integrase
VQRFLKTKNGKRAVDLSPEVGSLLREYIGKRNGLVFATRTGQPLSQSNLLKRSLHPLLEGSKIPVCGFHAFRRYRTIHLRKQRIPEALTQFWLGHAGKSITDSYDRSREDEVYRKQVAKSVGTGFTIPAALAVPSVSKVRENREELEAEKLEIACSA